MKARLGEVAREALESVKGDKRGLPAVGLEHLISEELTFDRWSTGENTFTKTFKRGQMLFGRRRAYLKKAAIAPFDGICSGDITVIEAKPDRLIPELLPFIIQNDSFFDFAISKSAGSLSPRVKWAHLKEYEFNLPSMGEQRKLTELLWAAVRAKSAYKELLSATDELIKSQFVEMFGDPVTNNKGLPLTQLKDCVEINPKKSTDTQLTKGLKVSFVSMSAVSEKGELDLSEIRLLEEVRAAFTYFKENDVLFAKITPCMENGKGAIAKNLCNGIGFGSTEFHILRPKNKITNSYWIYQVLSFDKFRKDAAMNMTGSAGQRRVPTSYLENYMIGLPPLPLQNEFAEFVRQADKSKSTLQQTLKELDATYKAIIKENLG